MSDDDTPVPERPKSAVEAMIDAQNEAARRFEENMGRKSTDPSPPGFLAMRMVNGRMQAVTMYDRNPDTADVDWFARAGIDRVHIDPTELVRVPEDEIPTEVWGRFPADTDPRVAVGAVFREMFEQTPTIPDRCQAMFNDEHQCFREDGHRGPHAADVPERQTVEWMTPVCEPMTVHYDVDRDDASPPVSG